jgi:transposase
MGEFVVDMRELKALELAARAKITFNGTVWIVPSQSANGVYKVTIGADPTCECDDFQLRKQACKHVIAARLVQARDGGGKGPEIVVDEVPKKKTYKQDWPVYDLAQRTEKDRFQELLADLCVRIPEPPKHPLGRPATPLADQVFASAFKVFSTVSLRRFGCDLKDAHEKGYLATLMNPLSIGHYLENTTLTPILESLIVRSSLPLKSIETVFAPDSTGFSTSRFVRWYDEKYGAERSGRDWVKAHAICGVKTNIVTSVIIEGQNANDCPMFKDLVATTAENFKIEDVPADKAYLSKKNLEQVDALGGTAFIPFKCDSVPGEAGTIWEKMFHFYNYKRDEFLSRYHKRSNIESTFSMVKAKFRDHVRSKTDVAMKNEVLCKFLCHNIVVIHQSILELGIEGEFWKDKPDNSNSNVLKFPAVL